MIGFIQAGVLIVCLSLLLLIQASHGFTTEATPDGLRGPIFLEEPPSLTVIQNSEGGVIPCSVYGRPAPVTQWIRLDGSPVENVPGVLEILHNNSLYFLPFDDDSLDPGIHTQTYRCRAENVIGSIISRSMRTTAVLLDQVEEFSIQLNDIWVMRGGTAVFSCDVNPLYVRDYVKVTGWTQSTTPIQADNRYSMMADGTLHVRNVRDSDGSLAFRCKATVLLTGATQSSDAAYIKVHDPPAGGKKPTVDDPFREITVKVDDTVELSCVTDGYPFPSYRWYKDGVSVNMADTRFKQMGGNLVVTKVVTSDTGEYKCNATNNMGSASVTRQLTINLPLSATITPATQVIDSGQSASFNCSLQGNPVPSVTWFKDGHPLVVDDHIFLQSATLLHINNVRRQDQGMYQCFAKNIQSEIQATSQLILGAAHPSFIKVFNDQYVTRGTSVTLRCIAAGNPTPVVTWILDGQPLVNQDHVSDFTSDAGDVISYVNISSANLENSGEYQCIATNNVGEVNHIARLNVYGIPYVRPMKNITATANEALSIRCYVTGYPVETITWHRDGRQLPVNHLQQVANGTLHILKVQKPYDAGEYTCSAVAAGGQGSSRSVYVNVLEPPVIDPFSIAAKKEGDRVTLPCVVSSGDLPIFIKWTKDGRDVPYYMGIVVETSGSYNSLLKIGDVNPIHDGNYTCHARNLAATVSFTAELHVDVPPRWEIEPQDTSVIRHNSVWLDCMAAGTPDPTIKWSKIDANGYDPVPLNFTATDHYMVNENGTLVISNAMEPDGGNYICHADNGIEHGLSKIIDLTVHVPARFDAPQKNYTVLRGYNITIDCQAIGDKPLSLTWTFKNRTVGSGIVSPRRMVGVQDTSRGKLSHFSFRPAQREDTGEYRCNAKNKYGFDMLHMRLTVLEPPESPANLSILEVTSRSVKLSWQPPFDGNSPLLNYIIEYQTSTGALQEARGPIRNISVPGEARQFVLENLHPAYLYNIRVRANNSVGLGSPSHQVAAKLLEEVPSAPPTEVEVKAIGSQKLQVTWKPPKLEHRNGVITGYFIGYKQSKNNSQFQFINKDVSPDLDPERQEEVVAQFIPKLNKFTKYIVNVKAYNKIGMGPASSDIEVFTLEDVPSQPPEDCGTGRSVPKYLGMAANPLLFDGTWMQRQKFENAETLYQEHVSGVRTGPKPSEGASPSSSAKPSSLKSEIAQARQNIQKALKDESSKPGADNSQILSRIQALESENNNLKKVSEDLQALVKKLENRIAALEKSGPASTSAAAAAAPKPEEKKEEKKADDDVDDIDFFSDSDEEEDEEEAAERQRKLEEYRARKSKKPALIAKSSLLLDVKPWDDETDMKILEQKVREIQMEGLVWGQGKLVAVGYGISKLVISAVIEDEKVSTDDLEEKITAIEDYVQSMDIAAFNKI